MALKIGDTNATEGMAQAIYDEIDKQLRPPMEDNGVEQVDIVAAQNQWKKLSYAIAAGVIKHLKREPETEPDFAETFSSMNEDDLFWNWLSGFVQVFNNWTPEPQDGGAALKTGLTNWLAANPIPNRLKGVVK